MTLAQIDNKLDLILQRLTALESGPAAVADPEWLRMPSHPGRCPVSRLSRTTLNRLIAAGSIRSRKLGGARFYSAADVRRTIHTTNPKNQ